MGFATVINQSHIDEQYEKLLNIIKATFGNSPQRFEALSRFYSDFEQRVKESPAAAKLNYHNAYEGGYLDHILNVVDCARMIKKVYEKLGGLIDFKDEELIFVAIHHDLGKLGTLEQPYYLVQDSDWHRHNRLEVFKHNDDTQYMTALDLTFFLLQEYNITLTQNEYLGIRLSHGMYDESNKQYFMQYSAGFFPMRCNLAYIIHWADHMASLIEHDQVRQKLTKSGGNVNAEE